MSRIASILLGISFAAIATIAGEAQTLVTLAANASPGSADPLQTNVRVTGTGFPTGTILPANVVVKLNPTTPGSGPSASFRPLAVTVVSGSTERITFRVPATVAVAAPTSYQVWIAGTTTTGTAFRSSNSSALTVNPPLAILTNSPLPPGTVGVGYSQTLAASGGTGQYTWSVAAGALPPGLSLNANTGQISGPPTAAGTANFTIQAADTVQGVATKAFSLTVNPPVTILTDGTLPEGVVGVPYSTMLTASGGSGQYTWTLGSGTLPDGLLLNAASGQIAGTPTTAATSNFTIVATDTNQATGNKAFSLTVNPPPQILSVSPSSGNAGLALAVTMTGSFTHFAQGTTVASFGPGVSVGGAAEGQSGPVTVTSPTSATAHLAINAAAATGSQTVTVTTGSETASLAGGFEILATIPFISVDTSSSTPIVNGIVGFQDEYLLHGVEYGDPKYIPMVQGLKPGFIRYPGGITTMAFDWQTAHENSAWITSLSPKINILARLALNQASQLTQAKGGGCFVPGTCYSDFATFAQTLGVPGMVVFNGFSDTNMNSAANMVQAAQSHGLNVMLWELANEAYLYPGVFPSAGAYATAMNPYATNIFSVDPAAKVSVFFEGAFAAQNYQTWDNGLAAVTPQYWTAVSTHTYPITNPNISVSDEELTLNGVLAHGTTDYMSSYFIPLVGQNTPIYLTETNSDGLATIPFEAYLYNGIYLAEYVARMSTVPNMKAIAVATLYLGNSFDHAMIRAVNDYEAYLQAQVRRNPNFSTNTATDPNTQYSFYYSAPGLCMQVANEAINSSGAFWPTVVNGGPTVPILGYDGQPVPAVFAQGYQGTDGKHHLLITNKSSAPVQLGIQVNGELLPGSVTVSYVSNPSDTATNTAANQTNVQVVSTVLANPMTVGPYSVTRVEW